VPDGPLSPRRAMRTRYEMQKIMKGPYMLVYGFDRGTPGGSLLMRLR
jgi:hypothetical protein